MARRRSPSRRPDRAAAPRSSEGRTRLAGDRWGLLVAVLAGAAALGLYLATPAVQVPRSDGFYSWMYARSLAFDGDLEFTNDYRLCGDAYRIGLDRGTGHPDNIFYPGPALFWVPVTLAARAWLPADPAATCQQPWTGIAFSVAPWLLAGATYFTYRLLRRRFDGGVAALATALLVFGGPLFRVATVLPSYSHVHDAFTVAGLLLATVRATERPDRPLRWGWVALALAAAILQRLSNAAFVLIPVTLVVAARPDARRAVAPATGIGLGLLLGLGAMGALYRYLYGSPFVFSHGRYFLDFWQAHPWLLLFDREEGLFFHAPVLWLSVVGLAFAPRDRAGWRLLGPLLAVGGFEWWLCAAALDWAPARRFSNLTPLFAWLAALAIERARDWLLQGRRALVAVACLVAAPAVGYGVGFGWGQPRQLVPSERPVSQAELYGGAARGLWAIADATVGGLAIWPAERLFQVRYGLPGDRFGAAAFPRFYQRDFRTLEFGPRGLSFLDPTVRSLSRGLVPATGGVRPTGSEATVVFAAEWRWATHVILHATTTRPVTVRLGFRSDLGFTRWAGSAFVYEPGLEQRELVVPEGAFASGLNEVRLQLSPEAPSSLLLRSITFDDRRSLPPAFD